MGRYHDSRTPRIEFRGVVISLYRRPRGNWEAGFTIPGRKRGKAYGPTEAICRDAAVEKIRAEMGAEQYAAKSDEDAARRLLDSTGVSLAEAARYWLAQHSKPLLNGTVSEVRKVWLALRGGKKKKKQYHHVRALESRSKHLLGEFGNRQIATLGVVDLTRWQDDIEETFAPRTARNIHDAAKDMWKFARKRGYLDAERLSAMEQVDRPTAGPGPREIYTPEEMQLFLDAAWGMASPGAVPMGLSAFGYARSEENCKGDPDEPLEKRICWEDIKWKEGYTYIRPEVSKTKVKRRAGLPKNLKAMIGPLKGKGPIYTDTRLDLEYQKIARRAGLKLRYNAWRHSCLTYAMLLAKSPTDVANMAGNSVAIIETNYRNREATKAEAIRWGKLMPRVAWGSQPRKTKKRPAQPTVGRAKSGRFARLGGKAAKLR